MSRIAVIALLSVAAMGAICTGQTRTEADHQRRTAISLEQQGKNEDAEVAWRALLKAQPGNAEAYAHLGFLEAHEERYTAAVPLYRKALALNPSMPGLRMNLSLALFKAGQLNQALPIFESLLAGEPKNSADRQRLVTLIGLTQYGLKNYVAAVPFLKKATAGDPQNLPFRLFLAHSCLAAKQYQCVLDVYREILALNAESAEADILAGEALDEMDDHAGATQQFRAAVKANPREPNVHFGLGYLLWTQEQYDEAAPEFQAELENVPNHAEALAYLADCNIKLNHPEIALPLAKKAVEIDPKLELGHLDLGILQNDQGKQQEALLEFEAAAKLAPNDVNVHWHLARLDQAMGRTDEAKAEFLKTKALNKARADSVSSKMESQRSKTKPEESTAEGSGER